MGKKTPSAPDPQQTIKAQADANRISTYTPFGNIQYGNVGADGTFSPNTEREASYMTLSPQQQQLMNYSDAAKSQMFGDIFGTYNAPAAPDKSQGYYPNQANSGTSQPGTSQPGSSMASAMASNGGYSGNGNMITTPYGNQVDPSKTRYGWGMQYDRDNTIKSMEGTGYSVANNQGTASTPNNANNPNVNNQGGGVGSFSGGQKMVDPTTGNYMDWTGLQASGMNGWGDPNLKNGVGDFYNLNGVKGSLPGISQDFSADRKRTEDAVYARAKSKFAPDFEQRNRAVQQQLADQGLALGSEAYNGELDRMNRMENEGYTNAAYDAVQAGGNEYQQMSDLALRTRGQRFGEETSLAGLYSGQRGQQFGENQATFDANNQLRNMQFNERLAALNASNAQRGQAEQTRTRQFNERASMMGMQPMIPQSQNTPQVDAMGAYQNAYAGKQGAYNSQMSGIGSLLGLGGSLLGYGLGPGFLK